MRYLGTFATEEEAARAFDQEAIRLRGTGIELNLPHEAEGFMQKLKEEEEANGDLLLPHICVCCIDQQPAEQGSLMHGGPLPQPNGNHCT